MLQHCRACPPPTVRMLVYPIEPACSLAEHTQTEAMDGTSDPTFLSWSHPRHLFHVFLSISSSLFVSPAPPSHALTHADPQGSLSAAELPPGASPSALLRILLFEFSLKQWQTLPRKCSTPGRETVHLHAAFLVRALPSLPLKPPRCCRGGNPDAALACVAPNKEYQTGTKHKSHLGKNKSSQRIAGRAKSGTTACRNMTRKEGGSRRIHLLGVCTSVQREAMNQ